MSSRECNRVIELLRLLPYTGATTPAEVEILAQWAEKADAAAPHAAAPVPATPEGVKLPGTKKRGPTRKEREQAERENARLKKVEAWFGPRQPLPGEVAKTRGYGHGDGC